VKSIWAMLFKTGLINVDFATLRQAFQQRGAKTLFGLGEGAGENAVADAIASLKLCPLLHTPEFSRKADRLLVNIVGGTDLTLPMVNELMGAVTAQFGRDSNVIMGAVIDEAMQNRVEVCVLGTSDMGGRGVAPRRAVEKDRSYRTQRTPAEAFSEASVRASDEASEASPGAPENLKGEPGAPAAKTQPRPEPGAPAPAQVAQDEFGFGELESRGNFEKTDRNLYDGQDLDVPTYLRKGIRIAL
jgi:cell division protein FtsZ